MNTSGNTMDYSTDVMTGSTVTEDQLNDLRIRFQLLEGDRKAYYEISMQKMKQNKEIIASLRSSNKSLRRELSMTRKTNSTINRARATGDRTTSVDVELKQLSAQVSMIRKNVDTIKSQVIKRREELRNLGDEAHEIELESRKRERVAGMEQANEKIRTLENRLDRALIKYNEAQSIRKTYEQIVQRLTEERNGYDHQLAAIERTMKSKEKDCEELLTLFADANHAKEVNLDKLAETIERLDHDRKNREISIREKKILAQITSQTIDVINNMEKKKLDIFGKLQRELSREEEEEIKQKAAINELKRGVSLSSEEKYENQKRIFEESFEKIKKNTGISDVNEVVEKWSRQNEVRENLQELIQENERKMKTANRIQRELIQKLEQIKLSGLWCATGNPRHMIDELENKLAHLREQSKTASKKLAGVKRILIDARAGIQHLMAKVEFVHEDYNHTYLNDDTITLVLKQCENALLSLLKHLDQQRDFVADAAPLVDCTEELRPYNNRLDLRSLVETPSFGECCLEKVNVSEAKKHSSNKQKHKVLTRNNIKRASKIILDQYNVGKGKR